MGVKEHSDFIEALIQTGRYGAEITNIEEMEYPIDSSKYRRTAVVPKDTPLREEDKFFDLNRSE